MSKRRRRSTMKDRGTDSLKRVGHCWRCGRSYRRRRMDGCHIIPRSAGGEDKPANLQELCRRHHHEQHRRVMVALAKIAMRHYSHDQLLSMLKQMDPFLRITAETIYEKYPNVVR